MLIPVQKLEDESPVPTEWRATIVELVACIASGTYKSKSAKLPKGVIPLKEETIKQVSNYLDDYGATLVNLPEETWESSIYAWQGKHWDLLIDLFTVEEGLSDMALSLMVRENSGLIEFEVYLLYVP